MSQTGTIQFQRPNRLAMRVKVRNASGVHERRVISDGTSIWMLASSAKARYVRLKVSAKSDFIGEMIGSTSQFLELGWLLKGDSPLDFSVAPSLSMPFRILSSPAAPVLTLDAFAPGSRASDKEGPTHRFSFRFGPNDKLLRGVAPDAARR